MEHRPDGDRRFLLAGLGLIGFGILWAGAGSRFLDRPDTTMMMGLPFLIAGIVVTLLALAFYRRG